MPVVDKVVVKHAYLAIAAIRVKARGRPGPNMVTGDYSRSWTVIFQRTMFSSSATLGTNRPQGRRLEKGFFGTDSLGRRYRQPPFPHVGPAMRVVEPAFQRDLLHGLRDVVRAAKLRGV